MRPATGNPSQQAKKPLTIPASPPVGAGSAQPAGETRAERLNIITLGLYYLFIFSLVFETVDIGIPITLSKVIGYTFLLSTVLQPWLCFRRPPRAFWWFAAYLYVYFMLALPQEVKYQEEIYSRLFVLLQMLVFFWIASGLMLSRAILKGTLVTLGLSCASVAVLQLLGIGNTQIDAGNGMERISALGQNPNELAGFMALGLFALLDLTIGPDKIFSKIRFLAWPLILATILAIVRTGSRGGVVTLAAGLLVFMFYGGTARSRLRNLLLVLLAIGFIVGVSYNLEAVRTRWEATLETGSMAHREHVFPVAWEMFTEKPLWGWGPIHNLYEIGSRGGMEHDEQDPHNLYLWILTEGGLLAAVPFFGGLVICLVGAWKARRGPQGMLPLVMMVAMLLFLSSGSWLYRKQIWLVLAYVSASAFQTTLQPRRRIVEYEAGRLVPSEFEV